MSLIILDHVRVDKVEWRLVEEAENEITKGEHAELEELE